MSGVPSSSCSSSSLGVVLVLVLSLCRELLGCCSRGDRNRGYCWLFHEVALHSIPFRVAREIDVVSVGSIWLQVDVEVVLPCRGQSPLFMEPFFAWLILLGSNWRQARSDGLRVHPCLPPVFLRIHDVIPFAANKSSAVCVALVLQSTHGSNSSSGLFSEISSKQVFLSPSWLLSSCSLRSWLLCSVVSSTLSARAAAWPYLFLFVSV